MSRAFSASVLQDIGRLFQSGTATGLAEGQLLERFVTRRDEAALEALIERHGPMVLGVCRRILRDPHDVEDAFQATFLVFVRKAGSIRERRVLGPWLHSVASKTAMRARALARRRDALIGELGAIDPLDTGGIEAPILHAQCERTGILDEEIGRLPEKYRAPVLLCYFQGLSHEEAAACLRWPVGTVRGRLARARDRLRDRLTSRGVTLGAALAAAGIASEGAKAAKLPFVSLALLQATRRSAVIFSGSGAGALSFGASATPVLLLTHHVLRGFLMTKLLVSTSGLAIAGLLATGAVVGALQDTGAPNNGEPARTTAAAAPVATPATPALAETSQDPRPVSANPISTPAPTQPAGVGVAPSRASTASAPAARPARSTYGQPIRAATALTAQDSVATTAPSAPTPVANIPGRTPAPPAAYSPAPVAQPGQQTTAAPLVSTRAGFAAQYLNVPDLRNVRDVSTFVAQTRDEVEAAIQQLTQEEKALSARLNSVRSDLARLKAMKAALATSDPTRREARLPRPESEFLDELAQPEAVEADLGQESQLHALAPELDRVPGQPGLTVPAAAQNLVPIAIERAQPTDATNSRLATVDSGVDIPQAILPDGLIRRQNPDAIPAGTPSGTTDSSDARLQQLESKLDKLQDALMGLIREVQGLKGAPAAPASSNP